LKDEGTPRHAVVSGAAERVPVHLPEEKRLALALGLAARRRRGAHEKKVSGTFLASRKRFLTPFSL
jgi:ribosomal protein S7